MHVLSVIVVFAISAGILLAAQSGCIGATLAGTDGSYDTPDTGLSEHAPVQAVTAWEGITNLIVACQIADTFADMLFTGVLDAAYAVHAVLSLTAVDNITDTPSLELNGAFDITTFESGSNIYAAVASYTDDGVQILNITNPSNITAAGSIDGVGLVLDGAWSITTFVSDTRTYAAVTAFNGGGVQILDVTNPPSITAAGSITYSDNTDLVLRGAAGITTFESDDRIYAAVTASTDNGVQILDVTNPSNIIAAGSITDTDTLNLVGARDITIFESGGHTYAAVAATTNHSVQILNVTDPSNITAAGSIINDDISLTLSYPTGITTFVSGVHTYAAVVSNGDYGVQILNVTDPSNITAAGSITDDGNLELESAFGITTFESGGHTYAAVTASTDNGVQILDVTNPSNIIAAGSITDTDTLELEGASGIATFESGGHTYVAVAAFTDNGVQIIRIDIPTTDTTPPVIKLEGSSLVTITVGDMYTEYGAVCDDDVDADKPATVGGDTVDTSTVGQYTVTYDCTDSSNNEATQVSRTVTVIETGAPFITTWTATDSDKSITLPMKGMYSILWGDGSNSTNVSDSQSHVYSTAGNYTVTVLGDGLKSINLSDDTANALQLRSIEQWGGTEWNTMNGAFDGAANMVYRATDAPDLSDVDYTGYMFYGASSFNANLSSWDVSNVTYMEYMFADTSSFNGNLSSWDVSSVTDMNNMFFEASSFNGNLSSWNVSSVINMNYMFSGASSFNGNLSSWDVSKVTNMNYMFSDASSFKGNLSSWDVSSVTTMSSMFDGASSFNANLSSWDVSSVIYMYKMFDRANLFDQNLGTWYVVPADTNFDAGDASLDITTISTQNRHLRDQTPAYGIGSGDHSDLFEMRGSTLAFKATPVKGSYQANVTASGNDVFENGNNWRVLDITVPDSPPTVQAGGDQTVGEGDTVTLSGSAMDPDGDPITYTWLQTGPAAPRITFVNASAPSTTFTAPAVTGDTTFTITLTADGGGQSVEDTLKITVKETSTAFITTWTATDSDKGITLPMKGMYSILWGDGSNSTNVSDSQSHVYSTAGNYTVTVLGGGLLSINLSDDTANAHQLESIEQWGSTEWTSMDAAFSRAKNMAYNATDSPDLSGVTDMSRMFNGAHAFNGDISSWDVSSVTDMNSMFASAEAFNQPLNTWDVSSVTTMNSMFFGASSFDGDISGWDVSSVTNMNSMFFKASFFDQPLNTWDVSSVTNMGGMFSRATAFDQDLANWYVVQDLPPVLTANATLSIRAQNSYLDGLVSTYSINDTRFVMDGKTLSLNSTNLPLAGMYPLDITAPAVLGEPNASTHTRTVTITVSDPPAMPFITTWKTTSADESITLPLVGTDITINWGDGSTTAGVSTPVDHTYNTAGDYTVQITGGLTWFHLNNTADASKLVSLDQWGTASWASMENAFSGASNMVYNATDAPDLSGVTDMSSMFDGATAFDGDLSSWDVSSVTDMNSMFSGASSFDQPLNAWDVSKVTDMSGMFEATDFNQPLNTWDVSSVTDMNGMFSAAYFFNQPLNAWDVSAVRDMTGMFYTAATFDGDISSWDVSSVTDMSSMFRDASSFDQPLDSWNVSSVTDMNGMFYYASDFNQPLNDWDVSSVTDMAEMFFYASDFNQPLNGWDVSKVTDMASMFYEATDFNQPLNTWDVSSVTDMNSMFSGASSFDQPLNSWNVSSVTDMALMFIGASDFNQPLNSWNVSSVRDMASMFHSATSFDGTLSDWDVSSVTDMAEMFYYASDFNQPLNAWDVSSVTAMNDMFLGASDFNQPLNNWNVSSVTDMSSMFRDATSFDQPLNAWNVSAVTNMNRMFYSASSFNQTISSWNVSAVTGMHRMFYTASSFNQPLNAWDVLKVTDMSGMFYQATDFNQPLNDWDVSSVTAMAEMFFATSFDQNLGNWYVVQDLPPVLTANAMFSIRAQNSYLDDLVSAYSIVDTRFVMDGKTLSLNSINLPPAGIYPLNITAPAVLDEPNAGEKGHTRTLIVTVKGEHQPFITTWTATDSDKSITLPMKGMYSILWGDGSNSTNVNDSQSHMYSTAGTYTVTVLGDGLKSISLFSDNANALQLESIEQWGGTEWTTMDDAFEGASNMVYRATDAPDLSKVTHTSGMFWGASSFDGDLSGWNVSSVTNMFGMFSSASSFNQTLNSWDVSSVTDMSYMFFGASSFDQPLNSWDVSSVTGMTGMFEGATSFNQPLNSWDVSSVIGMGMIFMFHNADDFDQNLGNWYVVANATSIARADVPGVVAEISAQNGHLNGHNPTYGISSDNDYAFFEIVNDNKINMTSVGTKSSYTVNVTVSGSNVFEDGNNWRLLEIKVTDQTTDTTPPVIKLEGSSLVTITVDETYTEQGAVCEDNVDADKPATVGGDTVDTSTVGQYTVTYDCTDSSNNEATQVSRTVNVQSAPDTDAPVIIITGSANIQLTVDETYTEQGAVCEDNVDADKAATVGGDTVDTSTVGQYTVTYDCTDSSNNEATQVSRTVNVQSAPDTDAPVIIITGLTNIQLTVDETYTEQGAVCEDNVDADKAATVGGDTVDTSTVGQYTVTYDCTDSSNNEATQVSRTVNVQSAPDTDAPVIIITGSANIQLTVDETYTEQGAVCEDNVDADKPATVGGDTVDTSTVGQYTVTYDCTDSSNNEATQVSRTVNVQSAPDTDAPVIIITGLTNIQLTVDETYTEQGAVCEDNVDADKPATVGGDTVDTSTVGQYTVTYDCTDSSNNEATQVSRTVNVQSAPDTDAPVIIITGLTNIQLTVDETYTEQGAVCEDNVDADKPATVGGDTVDTSTVGQYTVTYDCTDSSNNEATQVSRTVNVQSAPDTDAPVIIITGLTNIQLTVDETYTEQGAVCEDNVDADKPATVGGDTVDTSTVGQYTVTYDCTDSSNNEATQVSRTVNVQSAPDTDAPVIIITGLTNIQLTVDETYTEQGAVCEDNVDADKAATVGGDTVDTSTVGQYTVTYDCTDSSNNEATQVSRTVNVQSAPDTDAPVIIITGLTNIQLTVDETYTEQGAVCDDNVDADKAATVGGDTVDTSTVGQYTVTYDCTDSSNNEATQVSRTVNVQSAPDTDAPVIIITGLTNIQLTVDETYTEQGAVCEDNVDADKAATVGGDTVDTSTVGQYTVTYDCTDTAGNVATQVLRTVNVQSAPDTDAPVIIITGLTNIQLTVDETYTEQGAVCEDNVDADKPATVGGDTVDTSTVGQYTVTYDCTDTAGNVATQVLRTVNVQSAPDTDAPVIIITGLTNIQLTVDETYTEQGAVCDDDVDADKPATVGGDTVDTSTVGQYTVTYDCTDTAGNVATQVLRTVNVQSAPDTDAPVIIITGSANIQLTVDETYTEQGAVCDDDVDADKPATVGGDTVDTSTVGQYTVTYDCTDSSNNEATQVSRTVNVQSAPDTDAPVIIITGSANIQLTVDETYTEQGAVCDDDVDADKPATVGGDTVDTSTVRQYTVTYDCTDSSNNEATQVSRTVIVQTAVTPRITLSADAFITTWRTDSANQTITIPVGGSTARYSIDWGDNSPAETDITGDSTHTYREADSYTVSISGGLERFHLDGQQPNAGMLASIEQWGDTRWTTMDAAFDGATNMVYRATDTPDLSGVTDMHRMFGDASFFNGDLSSWDVSKVTDMSDMFIFAYDFNGDLSSWDVSSVTNMNEMFAVATSFNQPLNDWDVSSVTYMSGMFYYAYDFNQPLNSWDVSSVTNMNDMFAVATSFNQPLNDWDVSSVTYMSGMFEDATDFNQPLNSWNVSRVTNMDDMFNFATAFSQNLGEWYVVQDPPVLTANAMFPIRAQNSYLDGLVSTYSIDDTRFVMDGKTLSLNSTNLPPVGMYPLDITAPAVLGEPNAEEEGHTRTLIVTVKGEHRPFITTWTATDSDKSITLPMKGMYSILWGDGSNSTNVSDFQSHTYSTAGNYTVTVLGDGLKSISLYDPNDIPNALQLKSIDQWGDTRWTTMNRAFDGATNMVYRATDAPDLSDVDYTGYMFYGTSSFNGNLSSWDVSSVTHMEYMFASTSSFNGDLSSWDVSSVTDMSGMFFFASVFNHPLNDWDVSSVTEMDDMFYQATDFNQPLNDWDVSSVTDIGGMFSRATNFNQPLNDWNVSSVTDMNDMFAGATSFNQPLNSWNVSKVSRMVEMFANTPSFQQNLGNWYVVANATSIARADVPGVVAEISAQNDYLNGHNPTYGISRDNDYAFFEIVNGNKINMTSVGTKSSYMVNVTASGSNVFEDGNNWRVLAVSVSAALSDNADLGGLTISSGTLSPQFSSSDITYTASVDNSVTQVTVTPTASDSLATITVNGNTVTSGNGYIVTGLTVGEPNTVTVIVTAQDSTTKTYIITLTRAASLSGNADLGGLTISSGTLSPQFSSSDITYTASVDNSVTQVTVTPTASDSLATITVNGNTVTSGNGYIVTGLTVGEPNTVTVIVTAQDSTTKTYIITLTRAASLSGNADLGGLTISSGTLSPQFSSSDITYTASVDNSVTQVTVTPTASDSLATITVNGNTVTSGTGHIVTGLTVGEPNTVTVIVTAQDSTTKTYTITLTRAASLSGNADLGGLTISSGTLSPQFSSSDITYTASVDNSVTQVTVTPTASDSSATITVNGNTVTSGTGHIVIGLIAGEPNTVTVIVTAQDSTTKTYTITLTRAASLSGNADLGGLTISSGTLSPQFSSSDITYTASVDNSVTQVTVTPTASDSSATITVNGNTVTSGTGHIVIGLIAGEPNTVTVIVTAQDSTTKTYTITLTRAASLSGNADLGGLTISSGTLSPQFSSSDITYTASVDNSVTQVTVTPTASDSSAAITVNGNTVTSGTGHIVIGLTVGEPNTVTVIVTAQDSTTKTYTITLTRAASLSGNADLGGLTISSGTLSPQFSSSDITYTASVDNSVTQVTVTPTASDSSAAITVNGNTVTSGTGHIVIGLTVGEPNTVTVIVTAQDSTTKTYTITLTRAASLSGNADLGGLTISSGTLSPQFSSSDITYTASVDNSVTQVTVTPTASDSSAAITVNGNTVTSGTGHIVIGLTVGEPNTVTVIVTAQDSTTKTYTITLTRAASLSGNADLGGLTISSGTLSPQFSSSDITYTASVDNSVTQVTVTPTASDSSAAITVNGNTVTSGTGYIVIGLTVGEPNTVTVIVTAQDSTTKTYTITLTRAASLSGNADLGGLTISSGTLSPQFSSSDITYTASVDNSVTQVTVTPTASDSSAAITVNGNTVTSGTGYIVIGLTVGEPNTVTVIVTAQDSTTKTYTITLTRAASLSGNADLGGLTISSGTLSPQFSSSDITYTASVDNSVTQVTVTPTASDSLAAITVNGNTVISGTGYILTGLTVGEPNTVTVIVTAQDSTTKTYTITLTRAASLSGNADLGGLTISSGTLSPQFSSSDITYTASVDNSVTQVTVTPTASDSSAAITVNDNTVTSGTGYILTGLTVGEPNTVTVIVTAQDSTTKTYIITLTRAASLSGNADLGGLTISSGTLSPQFSSSDITYTASVDNSVTQVTVTPTASDSSAAITVNGNTVTSGTGYILTGLIAGEPNTVTVIVTAQDSTTKTYIITVTVRDVPITVSSAAYNPGNGQLTITFNQDIATVDYSRLHVRSSANPDTGGITLSSVTGADYSGRTITATLDSEQQDQYDALQSPHLVVEDGAVTDTDGDRTTDVQPQPIRDASQKGSSSSSKASIVHINALAQSRLVDIPPHIAEQVESHDASDPLEPITPDDTFDLPLVINGYGYLLDAYENTLIPQTVTAGDNPVHITFTVYTEKEFAHFILYLNLQGRNTNYADSDTYITYKDDGTTSITDPHGYIGSATVTVTQEDDQIPEKRTVRITIEFGEEPMGPTNMVAYMWNTDREALFVKIIDALEVVAASPESAMQAADPEPLEPDSVLPADPEPVTPDFADDAADPEPVPYDILGPDDYDDTQILQIIRMWSGFESESITDEQLLELLGLDDHQGADIPDWMMTELGVLVAKGTVTVDEFMLALQYVLEHV